MNWTKRDTIAATTITLVGGSVRLVRLSTPHSLIGDEGFYARDGCWYVKASEHVCQVHHEVSDEHPPLAKWLIGSGIRLFGFDTFGWRIAAALAGTLTILLLYILGKKILRSSLGASSASGLLAIDLLHVVHSRTAMLEVFVTLFVVAAILFWSFDRDRLANPSRGHPEEASSGLRSRAWRLASGAAAGAAVATKWSGLPILVGIAGLTVFMEIRRRRAAGLRGPIRRTLREEGPSMALAFVGLPTIIYMASYVGVIQGPVLALPWQRGSWMRTFLARQVKGMLLFHLRLRPAASPYASSVWSWPLLKRPMTYYFFITPKGQYSDVLATGSPVVWWPSLIAVLYLAIGWVRQGKDHRGGPEGVILAGFLFTYGPWLLLTFTRSQSFFFYMLPSVPFMLLALADVGSRNFRPGRKSAVAIFVAVSIGFFAFSYPVLTAVPLSYNGWRARLLFRDCESAVIVRAGRTLPNLGQGHPPLGWCWI
jgi:dolichyl-phosphate-mannose-protein mannosyltransferase